MAGSTDQYAGFVVLSLHPFEAQSLSSAQCSLLWACHIQVRLEIVYSLIQHTKITESFTAIKVSHLLRDMCKCNYI